MYQYLKRNNSESDEINISPLIDLVFILLIFFIVTTSFSQETGVKVNKPKASSAKSLKSNTIMLAVTSEGSIHIMEKQVDLAELGIILRRMVNENPDRQAIIMADRKSMSGIVVDIIDTCNLSGVKKVNIAAIKK